MAGIVPTAIISLNDLNNAVKSDRYPHLTDKGGEITMEKLVLVFVFRRPTKPYSKFTSLSELGLEKTTRRVLCDKGLMTPAPVQGSNT